MYLITLTFEKIDDVNGAIHNRVVDALTGYYNTIGEQGNKRAEELFATIDDMEERGLLIYRGREVSNDQTRLIVTWAISTEAVFHDMLDDFLLFGSVTPDLSPWFIKYSMYGENIRMGNE